MSYFADAGPRSGPILYRNAVDRVIGALRARDDRWRIGMALCAGRGKGGVALWKLTVRGVEVPGRWLVHSREFIPEELGPDPGAHEEGRGPRG
jgi:hypothetical protein